MRKLKKEYKRGLIAIIAVIIIVVIIKCIQSCDSTKKELIELGYSKEDATVIIEKLNEEEVLNILSLEYNENLVNILNQKYYIPYNLNEYLNYSKEETNIEIVISKVNTKANKEWYTDMLEADNSNEYSILVNKFNYITKDFEINDLEDISDWYAYAGHKTRSEVYKNYKNMWEAAKEEELTLLVTSSYRTYEDQEEANEDYGDDYASRPGHSEHQTGLALDISTYDTLGDVFDETDEFKWLQTNAHKYGFILRYPENKEEITGYSYESWHYRYLGTDLATKVYESGLTYDEYHAYYCEYKKEC